MSPPGPRTPSSEQSRPTRSARQASVAITGIGVVSPAGSTVGRFWETVCRGRSTADVIRAFDPSRLPVRIAAEVRDFDAGAWLDEGELTVNRYAQMAVGAARQAWDDAGRPAADPRRVGVILGAAAGGAVEPIRDVVEQRLEDLVTGIPPAAAAAVARSIGSEGWSWTNVSACSAGSQAIGAGAAALRRHDADVVVAGGADATVTPYVLDRFARLNALANAEDPATACRPFDAARSGCLVAEGAAVCVLERLDDARARGRRPYALVGGYACNTDATHMVMPQQDGTGALACMRRALRDADLTPRDVGQVNAHGTATRRNDAAEGRALLRLFGDAVPPLTAPKGVFGHMMGAAGAAESISACLSLVHGVIPPTANFERGDPDLPLDVVAGAQRPWEPAPVLKNSFAFGGQNATLILLPV